MGPSGPKRRIEGLVVVPARPGPLTPLPDSSDWDDELDSLLDDIFGAPPTDGPGLTDAVLVAIGLASFLAWWAFQLPTWVPVIGAGALILGLVLPVRSALVAASKNRRSHRLSSAVGSGTPLRVDDESVTRLAAAYHALLDESSQGAVAAPEAAILGHQAVLEVATLLQGRSATTPAEREYVEERVAALAGLRVDLVAARPSAEPAPLQLEVSEEVLRDAAVAAMRTLDDRSDGGSIARIAELRDALQRDTP